MCIALNGLQNVWTQIIWIPDNRAEGSTSQQQLRCTQRNEKQGETQWDKVHSHEYKDTKST